MQADRLFHFSWVDVVASADDEFLGAAGDAQISFIVVFTEITRSKEIVFRKRLGCGVRPFPITGKDIGSFDFNLGRFTPESDFHARKGQADRARSSFSIGGV